VRYEDLKAEPLATFTSVIHFCGLEEDQPRIKKAVEFSEFEKAQKQETEHGFDEKTPGAEAFFRKGQVGTWREELTPELVRKLIAEHTPIMNALVIWMKIRI